MEIVKLRVYIGPLLKNEDGSWKTENHFVKKRKPSLEWDLFLTHAKNMYSKVELIEVTEEKIKFETKQIKGKEKQIQTHSYDVIDSSSEIVDAITGIYTVKVELTADQKRIADLEAKIDALSLPVATIVQKPAVKTVEVTEKLKKPTDDLDSLREEYTKVLGKKPSHLMKSPGLTKAINEFKPAE